MFQKKLASMLLLVALGASVGGLVFVPVTQAGTIDNTIKNGADGLPGIDGVSLTEVGDETYGPQGDVDLAATIARIINFVLGLIGLLLLIIFLYAGFLWMTAGGSADQVKKAKGIMINAVIGLIIVIGAYAISEFVIDVILDIF